MTRIWSTVSIHAPRAGRDHRRHPLRRHHLVSIHAPRAGRDRWRGGRLPSTTCFNPRAPRGARHVDSPPTGIVIWFQSTRPARGATPHEKRVRGGVCVSIHAPRAGRDRRLRKRRPAAPVSIHAPRAGRDDRRGRRGPDQPVSIHAPRAGRDLSPRRLREHMIVSIHAPRAGRDVLPLAGVVILDRFNPRAPRGARPAPRP